MENISKYLQPVDFAVVGIYLIVLIAIGAWVSFIKKKKTDENLFLAGHSLKWGSIGFTMWGTNVGPSMLIASASIGYTTGVVAGNFGWYAFVFILLLALVFAPRYLSAKVYTLPEFMGKRFGQSTREILAWYTLFTILISWLSLTLFAGGILIKQILSISLFESVVILVLIAAFFTVAGGLKAVAYTNVFQMLLLIIVSFILTVVGISKAGGISEIYKNTPPHYWNLLRPMNDADYPWLAIILGYPIMGVWFWCTDQSMVQSVLGAKNLRQGQLGANFTGWLKILDVALFIIPGIVCFILFPNLKDPDEAYMILVTRLFPHGMIGLVMAVLIAALVSTIDSALNSLSTVFTMDIYVKKYKPNANQKQITLIGRVVTLIGAVIAVGIATSFEKIEGLKLFDKFQAVLGFIAPPLSVVFLFGVLWKKTTRLAANVVLLGGSIFSLGFGTIYVFGLLPKKINDVLPHFLLLSFFIFIILTIVAFLVSWFDKKADLAEQNKLDFSKLTKTTLKGWIPWILLIIVMLGMYIIFNGHM